LGHIGGPRRSAPTKSDDGTPVIKWLGFGRQYPGSPTVNASPPRAIPTEPRTSNHLRAAASVVGTRASSRTLPLAVQHAEPAVSVAEIQAHRYVSDVSFDIRANPPVRWVGQTTRPTCRAFNYGDKRGVGPFSSQLAPVKHGPSTCRVRKHCRCVRTEAGASQDRGAPRRHPGNVTLRHMCPAGRMPQELSDAGCEVQARRYSAPDSSPFSGRVANRLTAGGVAPFGVLYR
jgi:hypothetical protein